ncbi:MAG: hypothetical protein BMS9Abin33_0848 [Gammaproteobacteria bacterium]|nr:MAG: hypothetical protein BMS9Abin33_0848 [Gammaproteobacteria bacterium]
MLGSHQIKIKHMLRQQQHIVFIPLLFAFVWPAYAEPKEGLAEESMNPLSTLISVPFENNALFGPGPSKSTINVLNIKPIFPVNLDEWNLINRVTVPIVYTQRAGHNCFR